MGGKIVEPLLYICVVGDEPVGIDNQLLNRYQALNTMVAYRFNTSVRN